LRGAGPGTTKDFAMMKNLEMHFDGSRARKTIPSFFEISEKAWSKGIEGLIASQRFCSKKIEDFNFSFLKK
jgi:hypothetical protein